MPTVALGATLLALGVLLGAFGAHGLESRITPERMETWNTAALYHLVNAVGILAIGVLQEASPGQVPRGAVRLLVAGTVVFSGSLYALVILNLSWLGAVAPLGGLSLVAAWLWIGVRAAGRKSTGSSASTQ